jgi:hypothetical protein
VRFVRPLTLAGGRTDVIAYIDNPNGTTAAKGLGYTIELYSAANTVIMKKEGTIDLPPSSTVPVFAPNLFSGSQQVARAFITFDTPDHLWYRYSDMRTIPDVALIRLNGGDNPRITAQARNGSPTPMKNIVFIATVFDAQGNAIAASQTVAPLIPAQGYSDLVFTWPTPFSSTAARIDVVPVVPLP